jgi:hypothetical protein
LPNALVSPLPFSLSADESSSIELVSAWLPAELADEFCDNGKSTVWLYM